jgi:hypothetical protein
MTNFNPDKLKNFLQTHPGLNSVDVARILALKKENAEKEKALQEEQARNEKMSHEHSERLALVEEARPVVERFALTKARYENILSKISDKLVQVDLEQKLEELKNDIGTIPASVTKESLADLKTKLTEFELKLTMTEGVATPETLDVLGLWPSNINKRDDKAHKGWVYDDKGKQESLPTSDWDKADANIKPIFEDYRTFMLEGNEKARAKKVELFRNVIDLKNHVVEALKAKDPVRARALAEELKILLAEKKNAWDSLRSQLSLLSTQEEIFLGTPEIDHLPDDIQNQLKPNEASIRAIINAIKKRLMEGKDPQPDAIKKLDAAISAYRSQVSYYVKNARTPISVDSTVKDAALNGIWVRDYKTGEKKLAGFLRPVPTTTGKNRLKKITVAGRGEMTLEDYNNEQQAKKEAQNTVIITEQMLAEWPELAANHQAGQPIQKSVLKQFERDTTYERMFAKNENAFISMYATPTLDPATNTVRYVANERVRKAPEDEQEAIRATFVRHGLLLVDTTPEERHTAEDKKKENEYLNHTKDSLAHSPRQDKGEGRGVARAFGNNMREFVGMKPVVNSRISSTGGMVTLSKMKTEPHAQETPFAYESVSATTGRYEALKTKAHAAADPTVDKDALIKLGNLEHEMEARTLFARQAEGSAREKTQHEKLKEAVATYEQEVKAFLEKKKRVQPVSPPTQEQLDKEAKRKEALKKINDILAANKNWNAEKTRRAFTKADSSKMISLLAFAIIVGGGGGLMLKKHFDTLENKQLDTAPKISAPTQEENWQDLLNPLSKRLLKDLTTKSHDELAIEYAKSYVNKENPASVRNLLIMDAYKVLHEQGAYSMGEKQQAEVSDFIMALQDISQKKDYSLSSAATKSGSSFSRSDWYATPNITIDSYLAMVQDKIK